jgi:hypothetical protein
VTQTNNIKRIEKILAKENIALYLEEIDRAKLKINLKAELYE